MRPLPLSVQTSPEGAPSSGASSSTSKRSKGCAYKGQRIELRASYPEREQWIRAAAREGYLSLSDWMRDRLNGAAASRVLLSSDHQAWNTPAEIIEAIKPLGAIALDPCSNGSSIVPALVRWSAGDDGLAVDHRWHEITRKLGGLVYVNPPFEELSTWIARCGAEARAGAEVIALCPARTDTRWWAAALDAGGTAALWRGRIRFGGARNVAPFPIALIYWGPRAHAFRRALRARCASFAVDHRFEREAAE